MAREYRGLGPGEEYEGVRYEDLTDEQRRRLGEIAVEADANGRLTEHSMVLRPQDPAFFMLLDGHTTTPVVHRDGCYICEDPEFAAMGLPLCYPCPACLRNGAGMGHIAADDTACDECGYEHGPRDYDEEGLITGIPREQALAVKEDRHPGR
jgi:hypothetical protein